MTDIPENIDPKYHDMFRKMAENAAPSEPIEALDTSEMELSSSGFGDGMTYIAYHLLQGVLAIQKRQLAREVERDAVRIFMREVYEGAEKDWLHGMLDEENIFLEQAEWAISKAELRQEMLLNEWNRQKSLS